ncbi:MAG TPA: zinc-binding dehydrogenase [Candidatus Binataceae bacterium]
MLARPLIRADNPRLRSTRAGIEFSGEIAALGDGVRGWRIGEHMMGRGAGAYAECVTVNRRALMRIPSAMSWADAAVIPNVFVTAHDAIVSASAVKAGECVMVTAGPSGVGTAAIQIARHLGANPVFATSRFAAKGDALRALGAHQVIVIDPRNSGWDGAVEAATGGHGVDAIIGQVGGPMLADNVRVLAIKGRLASVGRNAGRVGECDQRSARARRKRRWFAASVSPLICSNRARSSQCSIKPSRSNGSPTRTAICWATRRSAKLCSPLEETAAAASAIAIPARCG